MADDFLKVEGLTEFRSGLRSASKGLPTVLTKTHKTVADLVVAAAAPRMTTKYGRRAKSALRSSGTQGGAFVRSLGPTAFGDEFGATYYKQFKPHLGQQGYAIYPTIRDSSPLIDSLYATTVLGEIEKLAFPD